MKRQDNYSSLISIDEMMTHYSNLPVLRFKPTEKGGEVVAIMGGAHLDGSFKNILGSGMMSLAKENGILKPGQPVIESSSGSMGEGLSAAGFMMGHHVTIVSDGDLPDWTTQRIKLLGAKLVIVDTPDPQTGWQGARENKVKELLRENPDLYWFDQNNNLLNPAAYTRWLVPNLAKKINPQDFKYAAFCVGSGGHFSALSTWLKSVNPKIKTFAIDRVGSITFGGISCNSKIRGIGNQIGIPKVIGAHMHLVDDVEVVSESEAFNGCHYLGKSGCFVGGSSGAAFVAASRIAARSGQRVLTLFADRGDIYSNTILNDDWMRKNGFLGKRGRNGSHIENNL